MRAKREFNKADICEAYYHALREYALEPHELVITDESSLVMLDIKSSMEDNHIQLLLNDDIALDFLKQYAEGVQVQSGRLSRNLALTPHALIVGVVPDRNIVEVDGISVVEPIWLLKHLVDDPSFEENLTFSTLQQHLRTVTKWRALGI